MQEKCQFIYLFIYYHYHYHYYYHYHYHYYYYYYYYYCHYYYYYFIFIFIFFLWGVGEGGSSNLNVWRQGNFPSNGLTGNGYGFYAVFIIVCYITRGSSKISVLSAYIETCPLSNGKTE